MSAEVGLGVSVVAASSVVVQVGSWISVFPLIMRRSSMWLATAAPSVVPDMIIVIAIPHVMVFVVVGVAFWDVTFVWLVILAPYSNEFPASHPCVWVLLVLPVSAGCGWVLSIASGGQLVPRSGVPWALACMLPIPRAIATIIDVASTIPAMISHLGPLRIFPFGGFVSGKAASG